MKYNNAIFGFILGLITPILGIIIMYFIWSHGNGINTFIHDMIANHDLATRVISLSLITELIPFSIFTRRRRDNAARGVLVATVLLAVFAVLIKFVW